MFFTIICAVLTAFMLVFLFALRYVAEGRLLRRLRAGVFVLDVLLAAVFLLRDAPAHTGVPWLGDVTIFSFMAQLFGALLLLLAVLGRFLWRRMLRVPYDPGRRRVLVRSALLPALGAGASLYGVTAGRRDTVEHFYDLSMKGLAADMTLAQLSDIHLGAYFDTADLAALLDRVAARQPDLLVITGDLFDDAAQNEEAARILGEHAGDFPLGVVFILGNHEYFRGIDRTLSFLQKTKVHVLRNSSMRLENGLYIAGADYPMDRAHFAELKSAYAQAAMKGIPPEAPTLLLAHHPEFIDDGAALGVDLTLTGHTHGSQFGLFGLPLFPVFKYTRGFVHVGDSTGYVHVGNGSWFPFRLGCPPEIAYFHLQPGTEEKA